MANEQAVSPWPFQFKGSGRDAISRATGPLDRSIYRDYDIRGQVAASSLDHRSFPLDEFVANRTGRAFGTYLFRHSVETVVVGFDARSYSEKMANAVSIGLLSTGRRVIMIGLATTPMVYFAQHHFGGVAGIAITASHNPNGWSGMKLSHQPSTTLGVAEIREVADIAESRQFHNGSGVYSEVSVTAAYIDELALRLPAPRQLRVVLDAANSVSGPVARLALEQAGHEVIVINEELDWSFPNHEPDPESLVARAQIQDAVVRERADCGISLDGDGDRLGVTDESGAVVYADALLALLSGDILERYPGAAIVYDVKCSRLVPATILAAGGVPLMTKTGHSHIKRAMRDAGALFAGERSGHFFNAADYYGYDDAIHAALHFLAVVARARRGVRGLVSGLPQYVGTPTMHAACADDAVKAGVVESFAQYVAGLPTVSVTRIDGVRAEFEDGWLLVRASSNGPELVIMAEANDEGRLQELYRWVRAGLDRVPEVDRVWRNDPYGDLRSHTA